MLGLVLIGAVEAFGWLSDKVGGFFLARKRARHMRGLYYAAVCAAEAAAVKKRSQREYISLMN